MFGTVLAMLNTSACRPTPRAAASRMPRTKPLSRDTIVPAAITALEESNESEVEPEGSPWPGSAPESYGVAPWVEESSLTRPPPATGCCGCAARCGARW